jgi:hypothetical protein|tara:strand:- start:107 stop:526 length:420 start_codon:yes stop_codon:yes gene_type:complete
MQPVQMIRLATLLLFVATTAAAQNNSLNLQMPSAPHNYQSDKFRAKDLDCSNAIGGATNFEMGVIGVIDGVGASLGGNPSRNVGVYARIVIPLDKPKERVNCNTLYQLELIRKRLEVQKLKHELRRLQALQNNAKFEKQ